MCEPVEAAILEAVGIFEFTTEATAKAVDIDDLTIGGWRLLKVLVLGSDWMRRVNKDIKEILIMVTLRRRMQSLEIGKKNYLISEGQKPYL